MILMKQSLDRLESLLDESRKKVFGVKKIRQRPRITEGENRNAKIRQSAVQKKSIGLISGMEELRDNDSELLISNEDRRLTRDRPNIGKLNPANKINGAVKSGPDSTERHTSNPNPSETQNNLAEVDSNTASKIKPKKILMGSRKNRGGLSGSSSKRSVDTKLAIGQEQVRKKGDRSSLRSSLKNLRSRLSGSRRQTDGLKKPLKIRDQEKLSKAHQSRIGSLPKHKGHNLSNRPGHKLQKPIDDHVSETSQNTLTSGRVEHRQNLRGSEIDQRQKVNLDKISRGNSSRRSVMISDKESAMRKKVHGTSTKNQKVPNLRSGHEDSTLRTIRLSEKQNLSRKRTNPSGYIMSNMNGFMKPHQTSPDGFVMINKNEIEVQTQKKQTDSRKIPSELINEYETSPKLTIGSTDSESFEHIMSNSTEEILVDLKEDENARNEFLIEQIRNEGIFKLLEETLKVASDPGTEEYYGKIEEKIDKFIRVGIQKKQYSPEQIRCGLLRSNMEMLPGYDPVEQSMWKISKNIDGNMPKSYRTFAFMIIEEFAKFEKEIKEIKKIDLELTVRKSESQNMGFPISSPMLEDEDLVSKLRGLKKQYYREVVKSKLNKPKLDTKELENLIARAKVTYDEYSGMQKSMISLYSQIQKLITDIQNNVQMIEGREEEYRKQILELEIAQNQQSLVENSNSFSGIVSMDPDFVLRLNEEEKICRYMVSMVLQSKMRFAKILINDIHKAKGLEDLDELDEHDQSIVEMKKKLTKREEELQRSSQSLRKTESATFEKYEEVVRSKIDKIPGVKEYHTNFEKLKMLLPDYINFENKESQLIQQYHQIYELINTNDVLHDKEVDFMISNQEFTDFESRYNTVLNYMESVGLEHEREQSMPKLEMGKRTDAAVGDEHSTEQKNGKGQLEPEKMEQEGCELLEPNIKKFVTLNSELIQEISTNDEKEAVTRDVDKFTEAYQRAISIVTDPEKKGYLAKTYLFQKKRFEIVRNIRYMDESADKRLAEVMARAYFVEGGLKCMSDTMLLFRIFSLIKYNIVVEDVVFLTTFFKSLMRQDEVQAKRLLILTYSQLGNVEQMVQLAIKLRNLTYKTDLKEMNKIIDSFSNNLSITIEGYKDLTEYGKNLEQKKKKGTLLNIGSKMKTFFLYLVRSYLSTMYSEGFDQLVELILDKIMDLVATVISFLIGVPFLKDLIKMIIQKIITAFLEFILERLGLDFESLSGTIMGIGSKIKNAFGRKVVESLDWRDLVRKQMKPQEFNPESTFTTSVQPEMLETIFYEAAIDETSVYNLTETIEIYEFEGNDYYNMLPIHEKDQMQLAKSNSINLENYLVERRLRGSASQTVQSSIGRSAFPELSGVNLRNASASRKKKSKERLLSESVFKSTLILM